MGGSILARNRNLPSPSAPSLTRTLCVLISSGMFPIRLISPLLAIGISGFYFLPETSRNIMALVRRYEERVPVVWDVHQRVARDIEKLKAETTKEAQQVSDKLGISNVK